MGSRNPLEEGKPDERFQAFFDMDVEGSDATSFSQVYLDNWVYLPPRYTLDPSDRPNASPEGKKYYGNGAKGQLGRYYCDTATRGSPPVLLLSLVLGAAVVQLLL